MHKYEIRYSARAVANFVKIVEVDVNYRYLRNLWGLFKICIIDSEVVVLLKFKLY